MKKIMLAVLAATFVCGLFALAEGPRNIEKEPLMKSSTASDKVSIVKEVTDKFTQLVAAINQKDVAGWEKFYSRDEFVSTVAGGVFFATRSDWVQTIISNFSMRDSQHLELREVQVIPLNPDTASLTSQEIVAMKLKSGQDTVSRHVFTTIWKRGQTGWQIIHSHESWVDKPIN